MQKLHLAALSGNESDVKRLLSKGVGKFIVKLSSVHPGILKLFHVQLLYFK